MTRGDPSRILAHTIYSNINHKTIIPQILSKLFNTHIQMNIAYLKMKIYTKKYYRKY